MRPCTVREYRPTADSSVGADGTRRGRNARGIPAPVTLSLGHAGKNLRVSVAFELPSRGQHLVEDGEAGRVAMIGRITHAVVVRPVERDRPRRTDATGIGELNVERDRLVLPFGFGLDDRAFIGERRVEVRALRRKRDAEESARGGRAARRLRPYLECFAGPLPRAAESAAVERGDLVRERRFEVEVPVGIVVLDR